MEYEQVMGSLTIENIFDFSLFRYQTPFQQIKSIPRSLDLQCTFLAEPQPYERRLDDKWMKDSEISTSQIPNHA